MIDSKCLCSGAPAHHPIRNVWKPTAG